MNLVATFTIGDYDFQVQVNPGNVVALMQRDVFCKIGDEDYQFLRSFYYEDIAPEIIRAFCHQFVEDSDYRELSLARKTDWAQCNDLFLRNCFNPHFQTNPVLEQIGSPVSAYQFFKEHGVRIIAHPEYRRIYQDDSAIIPDAHRPDPEVADIVVAFNQIEGVRTLASCQGVSGTVSYQNYELLTLSPHARYAYIWFESIAPSVELKLKLATFASAIYTDSVYPAVQSTGDNTAFLTEIRTWLAQPTI